MKKGYLYVKTVSIRNEQIGASVMVNNDYQRHLEFKISFQIDKLVTFHVRPVNEYGPEFTGDLDIITITEVCFSC